MSANYQEYKGKYEEMICLNCGWWCLVPKGTGSHKLDCPDCLEGDLEVNEEEISLYDSE